MSRTGRDPGRKSKVTALWSVPGCQEGCPTSDLGSVLLESLKKNLLVLLSEIRINHKQLSGG